MSDAISYEAKAIAELAAPIWGVKSSDLLSRRRVSQEVTGARQACMTVLRTRGYSLSAVGRAFDRDHGTVLHAVKSVTNNVEVWPAFRQKWEMLVGVLVEDEDPEDKVSITLEGHIPGHQNLTDPQLAAVLAQKAEIKQERVNIRRNLCQGATKS